MSRCFLYPPPGYLLSRTQKEFLIESMKLQKEREIAKAQKKKDKKEKKREEKAAKKAKSKLEFDKATHESKESYLFKYQEDDEAEQFESSNLTEEHGQNSSCSSDSTQNSNKRKRRAAIQAHGSISRIRLSKKSVQGETSSASEEKNMPKLAQQETQFIVTTTAVRADPLLKTTNSQSCPSTPTPVWVDRLAVDNATPSCSKVHQNSVALQYKNLIENWLPPSLQIDKFDVEDDQAWLFQRKPKQTRVEEKHVCSNDTTCGTPALWPRAQYIHDADLYALPYTLPF